ncbi:MAG: SprB repeat-containing protein, partial [Bacteroidetes bacterium]|nr:SprB repeat-containing protein [Bacteroidota bacterium]
MGFPMRCAVPLFLAAAAWSLRAQAQCDPTVPVLAVDLSASPSATWQSPTIQRQGLCCGNGGSDRCLEFVITLHPDAQGIVFNICSGAVPPGAMFYQIGCGPPTAVGAPVCLSGAGPHVLTFCKPGGNSNSYCITSIAAPSAGPPIAVNDGCSGTITSNGFAPGTVLWTSVAPGAPGQYNGYLACPTCANTGVTAQAGYPAFVDYQVCGNAVSPCSSMIFCDTVRVWFNSTLAATIQPLQPTVCFGAAGTTITAVGAGGTPPYTYLWNTGETTASIFVGPGNYTVQLGDTSRCPPTSASVVVTQFQQVIEALAGPDILVCGQGASGAVTLNGAVTGASGGLWSGGAGTFIPGPGTLNATYTPTAAEIAAGSVQLTLTTTGNGTCPGDTDDLTITFAAPFTIVALIATDAHCANTSDGTATVSPAIPGWTYAWAHDPGLSGPTASGLPAGTYNVTVTAPSGCDTLLSTVVNAPLPIAIADLAVTHEQCAGNHDGSITVTANGGTAPYHYAWNTGHPADTLATLTAGAGTYTVTVTDANGCAAAQGSATINALGQPNQANAGADLIGCFGSLPVALSGAVTNATGGTWSGGTGSFTGAGLNVTYMPTMAEVNSGGVDLFLTTTGNTTCPADRDTVHV